MNPQKKAQIRQLLKDFEGTKPSLEALMTYCERHKMEVVSPGDLEDYRFQAEHDARLTEVYPKVLAVLTKLIPETFFETEEETQARKKNNAQVEVEVAQVLEDSGLWYQEGNITPAVIGQMLAGTMEATKNRLNNMGAGAITHYAKQYFGNALTIKSLAEYFRAEQEKSQNPAKPSA